MTDPLDLNAKLNATYPGKVVRKDLTSRIKEGANVPIYVLEYLLGMYCATDDDGTIEEGQSALDESPITGESVPVSRGPGEAVVAGSSGPGPPLRCVLPVTQGRGDRHGRRE